MPDPGARQFPPVVAHVGPCRGPRIPLANVRRHEMEIATYAMTTLTERYGDDICLHGPTNVEVRGATFSFGFRNKPAAFVGYEEAITESYQIYTVDTQVAGVQLVREGDRLHGRIADAPVLLRAREVAEHGRVKRLAHGQCTW